MGQFVKYIAVGVLNTLVGYAVIFFSMYVVGLSAVVSNIVGYILGLAISYSLNRNFTFRSTSGPRGEIARFLIVFAFAYMANLLMLLGLLRYTEIHVAIAQVLAGIAYVAASFFLNKYYVFRRSDIEAPARHPPGTPDE